MRCCVLWTVRELIKLNITETGSGENVVLIHGWAMNNLVWGDFASTLAQSYRVICVELPGHGGSGDTSAWTMDELVQALAQQLPTSCHLLGWSLGGMIALAYARRYPQRVDRLVMMASSAKFVVADDWHCGQKDEVLTAFIEGMACKPAATIKRFIRLQTQGLKPSKDVNESLRQARNMGGEGLAAGLLSGLITLQQSDLRLALADISCPALMILGGQDQLIPVKAGDASQAINTRLKFLIIEAATHVPFLSHQTEVLKGIQQFIAIEEHSL